MPGQSQRQLDGLVLRLDERLDPQVLRAAVDVEAKELERQGVEFGEHRRHEFGIDAELLRAAAHLHAAGLELEVRVDADRDLRPQSEPRGDARQPAHLALGLEVHDDAGPCRCLELGVGLAGPGEADLVARDVRGERDLELAARGDVEAVHLPGHVRDDGRHGIGLDGVVQLEVRGQRGPQLLHPAVHHRAVIDIKRRVADLGGDLGEPAPADHEAIAV
jgi:hypothetical protein